MGFSACVWGPTRIRLAKQTDASRKHIICLQPYLIITYHIIPRYATCYGETMFSHHFIRMSHYALGLDSPAAGDFPRPAMLSMMLPPLIMFVVTIKNLRPIAQSIRNATPS